MAITFRRYQDSDFEALQRFNDRMDAAGSPHRLYHEDLWKNPTADLDIRPVNDSLYVAVQDGELLFAFTDTDDFNVSRDKGHPVAAVFPDHSRSACS